MIDWPIPKPLPISYYLFLWHGNLIFSPKRINMNLSFLLGVAAGVGAVLVIKSNKSKQLVANAGEKVALGLLNAEDAMQSAIERSENLRIKVIEKTHAS